MKYFIIATGIILLVACNSGSSSKEKNQQNHTDMKSTPDYTMLFDIKPSTPTVGVITYISLRPVKTGTDSTVELEIQHEKKIHFIVVSEDLSSFRHLHPIEQANGTYNISVTFEMGGNYLLYADFKPVNAEKQVTMEHISVSGKEAKPVSYEKQVLTSNTNGYTVTLQTTDTLIVSNKELMFTAEISKGGIVLPPDQLEDYLGEKAHMVIIGIANKKYLHVHPMVMGKELMLHTTFPEAGIYRAWLEFKKEGKVNVADFVIIVAEGNTKMPATKEHQH